MPKTKLDEKEIRHLATLAGLDLTSAEIKKYQGQLSETLDYIENLQGLDVSKTSTTNSPINLSNIFFTDGDPNKRRLKEKEVFQNVKNKKNNYFSTKKVL